MLFKIRLKTGFFETKAYDLMVGNDRLVLSSREPESQSMIILSQDISSIIAYYHKIPEIEIQSEDKIYMCSLIKTSDFEKLIHSMKENLRVKIICEYEGGNNHA